MSVIYKNGQYYGQEGGGSASFPPGGDAGQALIKNSGADDDVKWGNPEEGRAKSSAIAPVFDEEATYAEGDRVTYEDELYVFNKAHTGAWDSADADKSDVDSEIPDAMSASDLSDVKAAFTGMNQGAPLRMMNYSTEEQVVGTWIDGKPLYQRTLIKDSDLVNGGKVFETELANVEYLQVIHACWTNQISRYESSFTFPPNTYQYVLAEVGSGSDSPYLYVAFSGRIPTKLIATVQYTKTTDTAPTV